MFDWLRRLFQPKPTFGELIDSYMESASFRALAPTTQDKHRLLYPRLKTYFGARRSVESISYDQVQRFIGDLADRPGLANNMLDRLRARMRDARRRGIIAIDPTEGVRRLSLGKSPDALRDPGKSAREKPEREIQNIPLSTFVIFDMRHASRLVQQ